MLILSLFGAALAASPAWFGAPVSVTPLTGAGTDVKTGDFNGDGLPDISVASSSASSWYEGSRPFNLDLSLSDGAGGFTPVEVPTALTSGYTMVTDVADLDGDGDADLVAAHVAGFSVFFSDGSTLATEVDYAGARVGPVELGDVDADGDADLVLLDDNGDLGLWTNDGAGGFTLAQTLATAAAHVDDPDWDSLDLLDLNGDGALDVVLLVGAAEWGAWDPVAVWLGDGTGAFDTTAITFGVSSGGPGEIYDLALGDIDGNGLLDVVYGSIWDNVATVPWDGGFGAVALWPISTYAYNWVLTGDIDGDGDTDVVGTMGYDLGVLLQDSGALVDPGAVYPFSTNTGWAVADDGLELVDMNGDGCADLVTGARGEGTLIMPATGPACTGATPTAWSGGTGPDTGVVDTGVVDTAEPEDTAVEEPEDTAVEDTSAVEPPSFMVCSVASPAAGSLLIGTLAGLGLLRRRR